MGHFYVLQKIYKAISTHDRKTRKAEWKIEGTLNYAKKIK